MLLKSIAILAIIGSAAVAQSEYRSSIPRRTVVDKDWGPGLGDWRASMIPSLMLDFGEKYVYRQANTETNLPKIGEKRVVFLGDSITDGWNLASYFPGKPYVNRGIGAQVTPQMVLRFRDDVIKLKPAAVVILAGINDIQGVLQSESATEIEDNFQTMADLADRNGIKPIFSSILPINNYKPKAKNVITERNPEEIKQINTWLREFCKSRGYGYIDYYNAMTDSAGMMRRELTEDGIHPLAGGYTIMAPLAANAIHAAILD